MSSSEATHYDHGMPTRAALALIAVVAGCGHGSINTLVRVDEEPPGANCPDGGVAIQTGKDDNRNGQVDDDEITDTTYVCGGAAPISCEDRNAITGIITISSAADLAQLDGIGCVDGDLLIAGFPDTELPELPLEVVTGGVTLAGNPALASLGGLRHLTDLGGVYAIQGNDDLVDISALGTIQRVPSIVISGNDSLPDLAGLESWVDITHNLIISNNAGLLSLHGLENLESSSQGIFLRGNRGLASVAALDRLRTVAQLEISANAGLTGLSLASLQRLTVNLAISSNESLTSIVLPGLATLAGVQITSNPRLGSVSLPGLVVTSLFQVQSNSALATLTAPKLAAASGPVDLTQLPQLRTLDLSILSTIGGSLTLNGLGAVPNLNGLRGLGAVSGDVLIQGANTLTNLTGLGMLGSIGGNFTVTANTALTSMTGVMGTLKTVQGNLTITANPALPRPTAQAFASSVSVGGTTTIN